ncbi:ribosomal-processing cysteine protease Prp [Tetragenococcus halophilus]|uniref:ribosomal-processing cysteine protease Prp n=1 Tax=Tetragenococcus halophilus TaxID=51669 RepID=UPI001F347E23|nr:ribosomal-processing cysteine protease Prp [Tetragenococcus halophilus]MCF1683966.1 ribosomal-processing cysteine protease Prp [Tetragenococcus halophilus]
MIKGTFKRDDSGRITSYKITGHADAGEYGYDIVCAAVSVLAISTVNGIDSLAGIEPTVQSEEENGGYLYVEVPSGNTQEQSNIVQILLENLLLGMQSVQEQYNDYIQLETT